MTHPAGIVMTWLDRVIRINTMSTAMARSSRAMTVERAMTMLAGP
jgi:hypothetical protein